MIDCDSLPGHLRRICLGDYRKADGRPFTRRERQKILALRLKLPPQQVRLPDSQHQPPVVWSGIGDRLHRIIERETGQSIPCSECKREISRLNEQTPERVRAGRDALAERIIERARHSAPKWWQRWGARIAPALAKQRVLAWIDEACDREPRVSQSSDV